MKRDWHDKPMPDMRPMAVPPSDGTRPGEVERRQIQVSPHTVRVVPLAGTTMARYQVMDGDKVAGTLVSMPSPDDCEKVIRRHRHPPPAVVIKSGRYFKTSRDQQKTRRDQKNPRTGTDDDDI